MVETVTPPLMEITNTPAASIITPVCNILLFTFLQGSTGFTNLITPA